MVRPNSHKAALYMLAALLLAVCAACADTSRRSEWFNVDSDGWAYGKKLVFNASHADSALHDTLLLGVRHDDAYPYSNLWVEVAYRTLRPDTVAADGTVPDTLVADTFDVRLANEFGRWYGKGSGTLFTRTDTLVLSRPIRPGSGIVVRHVMRVDTLGHIRQVGLMY